MKLLTVYLRAAIGLAILLYSSAGFAWWNEDWPYRMAVKIDASASGANLTQSHEGMTVLLKLHSGNFSDFFLVKENLADFRLIGGDDKTPLKFHVEKADLINQLIYVWVKLPRIDAGTNTGLFWVYYGNELAAPAEDAGGSFDQATVAAYHFTGVPLADASAYATPVMQFDGAPVASGLIAGAAQFSPGNRLVIAETPALAVNPQHGATVRFWFKPRGEQTDAVLAERGGGGTTVQVMLRGTNLIARYATHAGEVIETAPVAGVRSDTWQQLVLTLAPDRLELFLDGNLVAFTGIGLQLLAGPWTFGGSGQGGRDYAGELDELVVSNVARNAAWIKATAINQGPMNSLLVPQAAEQLGGGGSGGLWMTLLTSNEESGWTIIFLLGLMALFSWAVMVGKYLYIRRVGNDNASFLADYDKVKLKNLALLEYEMSEEEQQQAQSPIMQAIFGKHDHYQSSTIYRLYHRGIHEVQERINIESGRKFSGFHTEAIQAIKASVDAQIVREIQRLHSKMVLLTIAISGGPFLGLLGTVLGVMITFAAIAATGDVNIAAIAPGVAAALLTTVAGLIVAIPALFGYNYLMTRIKSITADMKIFADEYVTRLAEYYRYIGNHKTAHKTKEIA